MSGELVTNEPLELIAQKANDEHELLKEATIDAINRWFRIGEMLSGAKSRLPNKWKGWCKNNLSFDVRMADYYVRLHEHREMLLSNEKPISTLLAKPTISNAIEIIQKSIPKPSKPPKKTKDQIVTEAIAQTAADTKTAEEQPPPKPKNDPLPVEAYIPPPLPILPVAAPNKPKDSFKPFEDLLEKVEVLLLFWEDEELPEDALVALKGLRDREPTNRVERVKSLQKLFIDLAEVAESEDKRESKENNSRRSAAVVEDDDEDNSFPF